MDDREMALVPLDPTAVQAHVVDQGPQNYMALQSNQMNQDILPGLFAGANISGGVFHIHLPSCY